ncbi:DNA ligase 1 [Hypsibius exemplaris]|uniref:DNA ligase n=1 Tax=Hypsibius exemplaris TaxID=2072580 RepID=A0A9X6RNH0_HYPEX|nr:DNA ligase 1 [Hypsibius exemplaris]
MDQKNKITGYLTRAGMASGPGDLKVGKGSPSKRATAEEAATAAVKTSPAKRMKVESAAPSSSPLVAATPTKKAATSPKASPAKSPVKSSTKSPAKSPTKSSVKSPAKSPSVKKEKVSTTISINSRKTSLDVEFYPNKENYHPIKDAIWGMGEKTPYLALAKTFDIIDETSSRLAIIKTACNFFRSVILLSPEDLPKCLYLSLNKIAPAWEGIELGVGPTIIEKAVAETTGLQVAVIKKLCKDQGISEVVMERRRTVATLKAPVPLTVDKVFQRFKDMSKVSGSGGQAEKVTIIGKMLADSKPLEAKFIVRALSGKMAIGLAESSALVALAHAAALSVADKDEIAGRKAVKPSPEKLEAAVKLLKKAYNEFPNYDVLTSALVEGGLEAVTAACHIRPCIPVKPMLAHPSKGIDLLLAKLGDQEFVSEYKYDGERAQIHRADNGKIMIYSRNQEDHTGKYPDIMNRLPNHAKPGVTSFIMDSEVVAWDVAEKHILPFQVLSTRKRKNVITSDVTVQVCLYAFDLLLLNGEPLISKPLHERQALLRENFVPSEGEFMFATSLASSDAEDIQTFMNEAIQNRCEGLMVKASHAPYEIDKRSNKWFKLKKDYLDTVGDSVDVVVIGAFHGKGKRVGTYGSYLCAVYNTKAETFESLCKLATGFSDQQLQDFTEQVNELRIPKMHKDYRVSLQPKETPDVWLTPKLVWEIKGADLSISPVHMAGVGIEDPGKGISLRFPRLLRVRPDKKPEDATDGLQIVNLYRQQATVQKGSKADDDEDDEY